MYAKREIVKKRAQKSVFSTTDLVIVKNVIINLFSSFQIVLCILSEITEYSMN